MNYYAIPGLKKKSAPSIQEVAKAVSFYTGISLEEMSDKHRKREKVFARHLAYYIARKSVGHTLVSIAHEMNRNHTSVINGNRQIANFLDIDDLQTVVALKTVCQSLGIRSI